MKFLEAIEQLKQGKKIRRKEWDERIYYYRGFLGVIFCHWVDDNYSKEDLDLHIYDIESDDWEVVEEKIKCPHCNGTGVGK